MTKDKLKKLVNNLWEYNIDGYIVPKNDDFFSENVRYDRLKLISNFSGSAGIAVILKNINYLFVDGRYILQAKKESGKNFNIIEIPKILPKNIFRNIKLGFDPNLFTKDYLNYFFGKNLLLISINTNLIDNLGSFNVYKGKPFYSLPKNAAGKNHVSKISTVANIIRKKSSDYLFISAPENIAWMLNIRGSDVPFSPIPNCNCFIDKNKKIFLVCRQKKLNNLLKQKNLNYQIINPKKFEFFVKSLKGKKIIIDGKTCSILKENIISKKFKIISNIDPCYILKSKKNSTEIKNMIKSHIEDGVALTKFLFWMKNKTKAKITEIEAEKKLENFRKKNKNYLYPSFNTIAGSGPNGAIVHYRASKETNRLIKNKDIFLCDSGGQYKYGTTDVTRTICFSKPSSRIQKIFTLILKGHIAVATSNLNKYSAGYKLDIKARKFLKQHKLDYKHGTGHGVGYFLNVHEGPQSISKNNRVKLEEGMIMSNEPGYYEKGKFGIRIENLLYAKKSGKKLVWENLTLAPIDKDLINYKLLNKSEKSYLVDYHLTVYKKLSKFLNPKEKKWLIKNL